MNRDDGFSLTTVDNGRQTAMTLPPGSHVMDYQIEMIAGNDVGGLVPFRYLTVNGMPCFHYDTVGLLSFDEYEKTHKRSTRLLAEILMEISVTIGKLGRYLLEEKCLLLESRFVYIDAERKGVKLVYLPADVEEIRQSDFPGLVADLASRFTSEDAAGKSICRKIITEVKKAGFRYESFVDFLMDIISHCNETPDGLEGAYGTGVGVPTAVATGAVVNGGGFFQMLLPTALPVALAAVDVCGYFGLAVVIRQYVADALTYHGAVLLVAVGAEVLLMKHFIAGASTAAHAKTKKTKNGARPARRKGGFSKSVQAASDIYGANRALVEADASNSAVGGTGDLWAGSVGTDAGAPINLAVQENVSDYVINTAENSNGAECADNANAEDSNGAECADNANAEKSNSAECADNANAENSNGVECVDNTDGDLETDKTAYTQARYDRAGATLYFKENKGEYGVTLMNSRFIIGRNKGCTDLALDSPAVGRVHAILTKESGRWNVADNYTKNGTFVNNTKIEGGERRLLNSYDLLTIADVDMLFVE